jgi:hypothetical protein
LGRPAKGASQRRWPRWSSILASDGLIAAFLPHEGYPGMAQSRFWGTVTGIAVAPVAIAAGVAKGAYDAASGNGGFAESAEKVTGAMIRSAEEFGEEHGDLITRGIVTGAAAAVGSRLVRSVRR